MATTTTTTARSLDLFLTPEERFEVFSVKSAERPHYLLPYEQEEEETDDNDNDTSVELLPLMDGCDIPHWRAHKMVAVSPSLEATLNVGLGCSLLRRERQLPLPMMMMMMTQRNNSSSASTTASWTQLRDLLLKRPVTASVERISCSEASQFMDPEQQQQQQHLEQQSTGRPRKQFSKWEQANDPVIITDCCTDWNWEAWNFETLVKRFGPVQWRFSDTHGALLSLETYAKYISFDEGLLDDAPLGIYDSEFGNNDSPMKELLRDYTVPPCFSDDLFALAADNNKGEEKENDDDDGGEKKKDNDNSNSGGQQQPSNDDEDASVVTSTTTKTNYQSRPPWRWILMGPPRSGTGLHIDPLWTNAWVTLLEGTKRWILIPPELTYQLPPGAGLQDPQVPSALWFREYYNQVSQIEGIVEILQQPGETVFVPNGWPHLVINLERTVAVTHNYASEFGPFERMWEQVAQEEPEFARRWYRGLCEHRPDLACRIQTKQQFDDGHQ